MLNCNGFHFTDRLFNLTVHTYTKYSIAIISEICVYTIISRMQYIYTFDMSHTQTISQWVNHSDELSRAKSEHNITIITTMISTEMNEHFIVTQFSTLTISNNFWNEINNIVIVYWILISFSLCLFNYLFNCLWDYLSQLLETNHFLIVFNYIIKIFRERLCSKFVLNFTR